MRVQMRPKLTHGTLTRQRALRSLARSSARRAIVSRINAQPSGTMTSMLLSPHLLRGSPPKDWLERVFYALVHDGGALGGAAAPAIVLLDEGCRIVPQPAAFDVVGSAAARPLYVVSATGDAAAALCASHRGVRFHVGTPVAFVASSALRWARALLVEPAQDTLAELCAAAIPSDAQVTVLTSSPFTDDLPDPWWVACELRLSGHPGDARAVYMRVFSNAAICD